MRAVCREMEDAGGLIVIGRHRLAGIGVRGRQNLDKRKIERGRDNARAAERAVKSELPSERPRAHG